MEANSYGNNKMELSSTSFLNQNMIIELIKGNYEIEYGLVNGTKGILKHYTKGKVNAV